jgi:hypothetical protein
MWSVNLYFSRRNRTHLEFLAVFTNQKWLFHRRVFLIQVDLNNGILIKEYGQNL